MVFLEAPAVVVVLRRRRRGLVGPVPLWKVEPEVTAGPVRQVITTLPEAVEVALLSLA
jgi:hypothetical protein